MKDFLSLWNSLVGRTYEAVNTNAPVPSHKRARECLQETSTGADGATSSPKSAIIVAVLGLVGILVATAIAVIHPYDMIYQWKLIFAEGGEIYEIWRAPPVELYLKVYLWNVTNMEDYMSGVDDKLRVEEVGPYVYRELMTHENVTFNDNGTLTTVPKHPLVWVPERSGGRREDDLLVLPNIALLSIAHVVSDKSFFTRVGLNVLIRQTQSMPLVKMTAREFMFGYSSSLMTLGNQFMPSWIYFDKLGLIDRMYDFDGDYETVYTDRQHGIKNIGLIEKYKGSTRIPQWESPCGDVTGASDGTKFPGYIEPNDTLLFFRKSMCRSKKLIKVNETVANGLKAYVYNFDPEADDNGRTNRKNSCFCRNRDQCLPPGLLDVNGCYYGFPIALSYPHFLYGDESLTAKVNGTSPDPAKHKSFFVIQPESGVPMELAVRYQINMALGSIKTIANCERFNDMVLPLLWTEIRLERLPENLAVKFRFYLNVLPLMETCLQYSLFAFGGIFLSICMYKLFMAHLNKNVYKAPWIEDELVYKIERKLSTYVPERRGVNSRELEVFLDGLVTPLNEIHRDE